VQSNESGWIVQAQEGDANAFTSLVEAYQKPVYNLCYRMLGNAEDAEDAAQETILRAYQSLKRFDPNRTFSTWLLSIAAHYCIDRIRRQRYRIISFEELPYLDVADDSPGVETRLSHKQEQEQIQTLLNNLNPVDRAAMVLYYWYDLSYEEICQELGLSISQLKSRMHRARLAMAQKWNEKKTSNLMPERITT
jgi:RNA polymerase sigma-70 factor (ECF subfamily)